MPEELDAEQIEKIISKRPKLKEKLEELQEDGIEIDCWKLDGEKPESRNLLLLVRRTYRELKGKTDYLLLMSRPGKNGEVNVWKCPAIMPGSQKKHAGGRPVEYGLKEREEAKRLRDEGKSIRGIAQRMQASTTTIQRLLHQ